MAKPKPIATKKFQIMDSMQQELAYSFHFGNDKNKSKLAKKVAKENVSGTTSLSNNAIQTAKDLPDENKQKRIKREIMIPDFKRRKKLWIMNYQK